MLYQKSTTHAKKVPIRVSVLSLGSPLLELESGSNSVIPQNPDPGDGTRTFAMKDLEADIRLTVGGVGFCVVYADLVVFLLALRDSVFLNLFCDVG